ncbi:MAG: RHS repeat protein [Lewinellaceae bacterium]|nr:RHS repeat protein [Lewinellaceae bacterium]
MKRRNTITGTLALLCWILLPIAAGTQTLLPLVRYFESDSLEMPGYTSVKVQTVQKTEAFKNKIQERIDEVVSYYDASGRLTEEEFRSNVSPSTISTRFTYDSLSGRLDHVERSGGEKNSEAFANYDSLGRLSELVICTEGQACRVRYYEVDEDYTERVYEPAQSIELSFGKRNAYRTIFGMTAEKKQRADLLRERFYDLEGRLEEIRNYNKNTFTHGWAFEYGPDGLKTKAWAFNAAEKVPASTYEYDEDGRLIAETSYVWLNGKTIVRLPDDAPAVLRYEYDARGRLIRTEKNDAHTSRVQEYTYYEN